MTQHIPESAMTAFVEYMFSSATSPDAYPWWAQMDVHGDPNSGIVKADATHSSYAHRDKLWLFQFSASPRSPFDDGFSGPIAFANGMMDSLTDNLEREAWGRYANYIDSELERDEALEQYFDENLGRLREVKAEVDPSDLFWNPQSVDL